MTEFTINAQEYIITEILEHLEHGFTGQAIARSWDCIKIDDSNLKFTLKPDASIDPSTLFWFGYLTPNRPLKS